MPEQHRTEEEISLRRRESESISYENERDIDLEEIGDANLYEHAQEQECNQSERASGKDSISDKVNNIA